MVSSFLVLPARAMPRCPGGSGVYGDAQGSPHSWKPPSLGLTFPGEIRNLGPGRKLNLESCVRVWLCEWVVTCVWGPSHLPHCDLMTVSRPTSKVTSRSSSRSVLLPTSITTTSPGWNSSSRSFSHCCALQKES